jgi:hypothetical protein
MLWKVPPLLNKQTTLATAAAATWDARHPTLHWCCSSRATHHHQRLTLLQHTSTQSFMTQTHCKSAHCQECTQRTNWKLKGNNSNQSKHITQYNTGAVVASLLQVTPPPNKAAAGLLYHTPNVITPRRRLPTIRKTTKQVHEGALLLPGKACKTARHAMLCVSPKGAHGGTGQTATQGPCVYQAQKGADLHSALVSRVLRVKLATVGALAPEQISKAVNTNWSRVALHHSKQPAQLRELVHATVKNTGSSTHTETQHTGPSPASKHGYALCLTPTRTDANKATAFA